MVTGGAVEDVAEDVLRELAPLEIPAVSAGSGLPSAASDASPSRDRLARIAAMIRDADQAMAVNGHRQRRVPGRLIPLSSPRSRARLRRGSADGSVRLAS